MSFNKSIENTSPFGSITPYKMYFEQWNVQFFRGILYISNKVAVIYLYRIIKLRGENWKANSNN